MSVTVGIGGVRRNAAAAVCSNGVLVSACEQERVVRVRQAGMPSGRLPAEAVELVLKVACKTRDEVSTYGVAEEGVKIDTGLPHIRLDHHHAHAAAAFLTSPFEEAVTVVCDQHSTSGVSVWAHRGRELRAERLPWRGPGFASLYSDLAEALGFRRDGEEHKVEALARLGQDGHSDRARSLVTYEDYALQVDARFKRCIADWAGVNGRGPATPRASAVAGDVQHHLADLLLAFLRQVRCDVALPNLCLAGGLFYNTYLNTRIAESGIFEQVFVPVNPGNAGLAAGAALALGACDTRRPPQPVSPFLGPAYTAEDIKAVLDNCKLSYEYADEQELLQQVVDALARGQLVGWFQDRMEWGHRALGNRSILASPLSPYVLENLNVFLKAREPYRAYGVSVCEDDAPQYFLGPPRSPFMEYEYTLRDRERLRHLMAPNATRLRVQTVGTSPLLFAALLRAFGQTTGLPVLVNTSFNGLHEPIVCTPRDAVRVFYGTGLDMLVLGRFILRK